MPPQLLEGDGARDGICDAGADADIDAAAADADAAGGARRAAAPSANGHLERWLFSLLVLEKVNAHAPLGHFHKLQ
jgi:hypothetical protein